MLEKEGEEVSGSQGYKYFGAARDLPGVRELFDAAPADAPKKTRCRHRYLQTNFVSIQG
jgi:pre-mRNA-splicing factor ISY1